MLTQIWQRKFFWPDKQPHTIIARYAQSMPEKKFDEYFKFGFVRNPWDRMVSLYHRNIKWQQTQMWQRQQVLKRVGYSNASNFEEYVRSMKCASSEAFPNRYQLDWFVDCSGNIIVDFIGRFEQIDKDWEKIATKLNIDNTLLKQENKSADRKHYTEYYNQRTRDIISRRFAVDIDYFEYEFGD